MLVFPGYVASDGKRNNFSMYFYIYKQCGNNWFQIGVEKHLIYMFYCFTSDDEKCVIK